MAASERAAPRERARIIVEEAGAADALADALTIAGLERLPDDDEALTAFLDGPLTDALVGRVHPSTAAQVIERIRVALSASEPAGSEPAGSGRRPRPALDDDADQDGSELLVPTVPPPAEGQALREYEDLATGAVHDRSTPAWGMRRVSDDAVPGEALWIVVSHDRPLVEATQTAAPSGVEVIVASSMAVLKGALSRATHPSGAVVLDAERPSIPLDRSIATLAAHEGPTRILIWRMEREERERRAEETPRVRSWLPCDAEVTPAEIVQLLGV